MSNKSYDADRRELERAKRMYNQLWLLWDAPGDRQFMDGTIVELRIRRPKERDGETLVVLKARDGLRSWVAFHSGPDAGTAVEGALARLANQSLKWKEDEWGPQVKEAPDGGPE